MSNFNSYTKGVLSIAVLLLLAACAGHVTRGDRFAKGDDWVNAIMEYRQAAHDDPDDIEIRSRMRLMELKGAEFYYYRGQVALGKGDLDGAIGLFQQGLVVMPTNDKLQTAMHDAQLKKEAVALYQEAVNLMNAGKLEDARQRFNKVLAIDPDNKETHDRLTALEKQQVGADGDSLALTSTAPITLNFRETDIRDAYEFLTKSFGVNVIFDDGVKNVPVTLFARDVTFEQGLGLLLMTSKTFYRKIGPNSILVALDNKEKRGQYEDQIVRTFELNTVRAKEMADIIKGVLNVKKIVINEQLNTLTVRDSEEIIRLIDRMIQNNDKKLAEVVLEVEILEINRTKAENLGLDFGSYQVSASIPPYPFAKFKEAKANSALTLPSATMHFFKQDVDAKILANPRVRVLSGKSAKIHIGDRVPLLATTIQDATGQVRNTFDYKDIGIRLTAEPTVHLDNAVTVKLGLEVSSLGQNLGTASQPAFSIGSRDAETFMMLRDGETAILGGLIQDSERNSKIFLPGFGDIPVLGAIFSNYNNSNGRTDVLLTITPRVVRGWEQPPVPDRQFYSGTENTYSDKQLFAELKTTALTDAGAPVVPRIETNGGTAVSAATTTSSATQVTIASQVAATIPPETVVPKFGFSEGVYEIASGQDVAIRLTGENLAGVTSLPIEVLYNAQVLNFVKGEPGAPTKTFNATADATKGVMNVSVGYDPDSAPKGASVIATLSMHAGSPGVSYLIYRNKTVVGIEGKTINVQSQAARVVVN